MTSSTNRARSIRPEDAQVLFDVGDGVRFLTADGTLTGTVEKLNPKRARVSCGTVVWAVPYHGLEHVCRSTAQDREERMTRLEHAAGRARELMDRHGLDEWALRFNGARKKLGECRPRQKLILISQLHALSGAPGQVTDTILHEIARGEVRTGTIVRMNPKRAKVKCGNVMWSVPYARLGTDRRPDLEPPED